MTLFGIKSDGVTMNTRSIQRAIDYIAQQGGGRLVFTVGRYLTIMQWQYESDGTSHETERWELHGNISRNGYESAIVGRYGGCFEEGIWWVCAPARIARH